MRRLLKLFGMAAGLGSAAALVAVVPAAAGPNGTGGGPTAEHVQGSGSDTTQILMMHLDGLYMVSEGCAKFTSTVVPLDFSCISPDPTGTILSENYEHDQLQEADFLGSSNGIKQLCTQGQTGTAYIDFARSSRANKAGDCTGLHFVAYARDGISLESNDDGTTASGIDAMNNTFDTGLCSGQGFCLTQNQVKGIYVGCSITNWSQVGGQNIGIQIYTEQAGSGTRSAFEGFIGGSSTTCIPAAQQPTHVIPENQNSGAIDVGGADQHDFIFPFSFAIYHTEVNDAGGYRLAKVDGVTPNAASIGCLVSCTAFPYSRYVYNVFCASSAAGTCGAAPGHIATQRTIDYVGEEGWICKPGSNENAGWSGAGTPSVDANMALPHTTSPHYNNNWATLINRKITARGFAPLSIDVIGGGDLASDHCRLTTT